METKNSKHKVSELDQVLGLATGKDTTATDAQKQSLKDKLGVTDLELKRNYPFIDFDKSTVIPSNGFIKEFTLYGKYDKSHDYRINEIWRAYDNGSSVRWRINIYDATSKVVVAQYTATTEESVIYVQELNNSGVYAKAIVDWSTVKIGRDQTVRLCLSKNVYNPYLSPSINDINSEVDTISSFSGIDDISDTIEWLDNGIDKDMNEVVNVNLKHSVIVDVKKGDYVVYESDLGIGNCINILLVTEDNAHAYPLFNATTPLPFSYKYVFAQDCRVIFNARVGKSFKLYSSSFVVNCLAQMDDCSTGFDGRKYIPLLSNAKMPSKTGNNDYKEDIVSLIHFSDVHNDIRRINRILQFRDKFSQYIDDIIHTGDICGMKYPDYNENIENLKGFGNVLQVIGNHDVYDHNNVFPSNEAGYSYPEYFATETEKYGKFMRNISNWTVVNPSGRCYYYKDYSSAKIRLIVVDAMAVDDIQVSWVTTTLEDAKTKGYAVVIADHFKPTSGADDVEGFNTAFHSLTDLMSPDHTERLGGIISAVDTFIDNGGDFACWICGHTHYDQVARVKSHPNQMFIAVGKAARDMGWQDSYRELGQDTEDLFNVISFDYHMKIIKVFRVGGEVDQYMRHRGGFTLKWDTRELLATW